MTQKISSSTRFQRTINDKSRFVAFCLFVAAFFVVAIPHSQAQPDRRGGDNPVQELLTKHSTTLKLTENQKKALVTWQAEQWQARRDQLQQRRNEGGRNAGPQRDQLRNPSPKGDQSMGRPSIHQGRAGQQMRQGQRMRRQRMRQGQRMGQGQRMRPGQQMRQGQQISKGQRSANLDMNSEDNTQQMQQRFQQMLDIRQEISEILTDEQMQAWDQIRIREVEQEFDASMIRHDVRLQLAGVDDERRVQVLDILKEPELLKKNQRIAVLQQTEVPGDEEIAAMLDNRMAMAELRKQAGEKIKDILTANEFQKYRSGL